MIYFEKHAKWPFESDEDKELPFYRRKAHPSIVALEGIGGVLSAIGMKNHPPKPVSVPWLNKINRNLWIVPLVAGAGQATTAIMRMAVPTVHKENYDQFLKETGKGSPLKKYFK